MGHLQEDQLKKIEAVQKQKILQVQQDAIHENLTRLQNWDLAEGQTLEQRRQAHREIMIHGELEENAALQNAAAQQLGQANAAAAAPGAPVQEHPPAKQTFKQRREQARKAKVARKHCPVGTADTYDCVEATSRVVQERKNALNSLSEVPKGVDPRILGAFCQGYKLNKKGKPATPEDQARANSDNAFFDAYISKDLQRRKPYLEAFRKELMDFPLSADTTSNAYIVKNAEILKRITDRACYYENIMNDPINKPYFDSLDPAELELLSEKMDVMDKLGNYYNNRLGAMGVSSNGGDYFGEDRSPAIPMYKGMADANHASVTAIVAGWEQQKKDILKRHTEADIQAEKQRIMGGIEKNPLPENMGFAGPAAGYAADELKRYRSIIEAHPDIYRENRALIDQLYQELYRSLDVLNDMNTDDLASQRVMDAISMKQEVTAIEQIKAEITSQIQSQQLEQRNAAQDHLNAIKASLEFYLKGAPLSDGAKALLVKLGQDGGALTYLDHQQAVRRVFLGEGGTVETSNQALKDARENGASPESARSAALQALGIRVSTTPAAMANQDLRKDAFVQLPKEIAQKFHDAEGAGADMNAMQKDMKKDYLPHSQNGYVTGGGVDAVNEDLLALYGTYLSSDASVQYLKFMCQTLKDAEVFSGDSGQMLAFLSQSLLNSFGANFSEVNAAQDSYQNGAAVRKVALESCRTLLSLPAMARLSEDARSNLPEATQKLAEQYIRLLRQVHEKIHPAASGQ